MGGIISVSSRELRKLESTGSRYSESGQTQSTCPSDATSARGRKLLKTYSGLEGRRGFVSSSKTSCTPSARPSMTGEFFENEGLVSDDESYKVRSRKLSRDSTKRNSRHTSLPLPPIPQQSEVSGVAPGQLAAALQKLQLQKWTVSHSNDLSNKTAAISWSQKRPLMVITCCHLMHLKQQS